MDAKIEWHHKGVYLEFTGEVSNTEIIYYNDVVIGHPNFDELDYQIWNFSNVKVYHFEKVDAREVAALDTAASVWNKQCKIAIITTDQKLIEFVKVYQDEIKNTEWECQIFNTYNEAKEWASIKNYK